MLVGLTECQGAVGVKCGVLRPWRLSEAAPCRCQDTLPAVLGFALLSHENSRSLAEQHGLSGLVLRHYFCLRGLAVVLSGFLFNIIPMR